jgi:hypothetical protein
LLSDIHDGADEFGEIARLIHDGVVNRVVISDRSVWQENSVGRSSG